MLHITQWTARRSGGRITVTGLDDRRESVRLTEVDQLHLTSVGIAAVKVGRTVALLATGA